MTIRLDYLLVPITAGLDGDMCTEEEMYILLNTEWFMATGSLCILGCNVMISLPVIYQSKGE